MLFSKKLLGSPLAPLIKGGKELMRILFSRRKELIKAPLLRGLGDQLGEY
jgi:hypothetical protein